MKKLLLIPAALTILLVGGVAVADDPDGDIQRARDLLAQADGILAAEQAKPPAVTTVTETVTLPPQTVTETVTVTVTQTVTTTPPPPGPTCTGTDVAPGTGLKAAMDAAPAGTTFCLAAGTYEVNQTISLQADDTVIGAGRDATFIDGTGLPISSPGIFTMGGITGTQTFRDLEIFGAPTPAGGVTGVCSPNANCGKAFSVGNTGTLQLLGVDCRDNDSNCVGGGGSANVVMDDVDCWGNGSEYSMNKDFRSAACVKRAASYTAGGGDTTITNSNIHDNDWVGVWCDFCKFGTLTITDSSLSSNGRAGLQWEMSGGWSDEDDAILTRVTIQNNGWRDPTPSIPIGGGSGGIMISTATSLTVRDSIFGGNRNSAGGVNRAWIIIRTERGQPWSPTIQDIVFANNTLNGDVGDCGTGVTCTGNV